MLTRTELAQLERSHRGGKALSVYLDGTSHDPAQRTAWRRELRRTVAEMREELHGASHAEREAFDRCVERMEESLEEHPGALRARGWVGFFPEEGVAHTEALPLPLPLVVAWGDGIRVAPYIRALKQHQPAILALVDARMARLHRYAHGILEEVETLRAVAHLEPPDRLGAPPRQGFHTGTRGITGADEAARELRAGTADMLRELSDRLVRLAGTDGWILVGGIPQVVSDTLAVLPRPVQPRVHRIESLDVHATPAQLREATERGITAVRRERDMERVAELLERFGAGGHGIAGFAPTLEALHEHAVDALYFTGNFLRSNPLGAEQLVRAAFEQAAHAEYVSGAAGERLDEEAGGVGGALRFVPVRGQPPIAATATHPALEPERSRATSLGQP